MNTLAPDLPHAGFTLRKVDPREADHYPHGTTYAGLIRTPAGNLWGVMAYVVERNGRHVFEGGLYAIDHYGRPASPQTPESNLVVAAPQPPQPTPAPAAVAPPCADLAPAQAIAPPTGKLSDAPPTGDLVQMAEAIAQDHADFDDSTVLEGLPL